jgi:dTMP kinase
MFIVIEGIDGAGKSTQVEMLAKALDGKAMSFHRYGTPVGRTIKGLLYNDVKIDGDNAEQGRALILQSLAAIDKYGAAEEIESSSQIIVADRWWPSAYAYGCADGLDPDWLVDIHGLLPVPDLNILLDIDVKQSAERMAARGRPLDSYEKDTERMAQVRQNYRDLWASDVLKGQSIVVSADGDQDDVTQRLLLKIMGIPIERLTSSAPRSSSTPSGLKIMGIPIERLTKERSFANLPELLDRLRVSYTLGKAVEYILYGGDHITELQKALELLEARIATLKASETK